MSCLILYKVAETPDTAVKMEHPDGYFAESSESESESDGSDESEAPDEPTASSVPRTLKRPAAHIAKSSAGAAQAKGRPPLPKLKMGTTIFYLTGKINVSVPKQAFRVFPDKSNVVDKLVRWQACTSHKAAWIEALKMIEAFAATKRK